MALAAHPSSSIEAVARVIPHIARYKGQARLLLDRPDVLASGEIRACLGPIGDWDDESAEAIIGASTPSEFLAMMPGADDPREAGRLLSMARPDQRALVRPTRDALIAWWTAVRPEHRPSLLGIQPTDDPAWSPEAEHRRPGTRRK